MMNWVTGGIVVVHMTVHSASVTVADERHFGRHGGGRFVLLLLEVVSSKARGSSKIFLAAKYIKIRRRNT